MARGSRRRFHAAAQANLGRPGRVFRQLVVALLLAVVFPGPERSYAEPIELAKGLFLIAEPALRDPNFRETVILITHHDATGTMGVIINRPTATPLSHLLPDRSDLEGRTETLYLGGPVERNILVLLVRMRSAPEHAHRVFGNVYLTQSIDVLDDALNSGDPPAGIRLFAGYAGWAPGQLADEIAAGGWRVVPADASVVFDRDADMIWKEMIRRTSEHFI